MSTPWSTYWIQYLARSMAALLLVVPLVLPAPASGQSNSSGYQWYQDGSGESGSSRQQRISGYRQSSAVQKKIDALDDDEVEDLPIPILFGVTLRDISPNFGDPRSGGRTHEGEDIMAPLGTPIVSPTEAVVLRTGTGETEGKYVYTANPGGETFVYMHLSDIGEDVSAGDVLKKGGLIGYVGDTGNAKGGPAHLHFEIHASSRKALDPFPRITLEFSVKEKISYLDDILENADDEEELAEFLAANFRSTFLAALAADIELPKDIVEALGTVAAKAPSGVRDLELDMTGEDVRTLQILLNANKYTVAASGAGSVGNETTYFGPATKAAVIKFQTAKNIQPAAGYVGPLTRAALAAL